MINHFESATVGEIVATDFRAAAVFERFGIDFCCGGRQPFADACRAVHADPAIVIAAVSAIPAAADVDSDVTTWPVTTLVDHIVGTHHQYVKSALPTIDAYLLKLQQVHGARHPELADVAGSFDEVSRELLQHMMKEEQVLFPYIHQLAALEAAGRPLAASPFGTVGNPIRMMEREHQQAGDQLRAIRERTGGYAVPDDGCTTYAVCYQELRRFEQDLHLHVHLENNILFPAAIELEARLTART